VLLLVIPGPNGSYHTLRPFPVLGPIAIAGSRLVGEGGRWQEVGEMACTGDRSMSNMGMISSVSCVSTWGEVLNGLPKRVSSYPAK
jgi:hypothetical protein